VAQVDPMKPNMKPPRTKRLILKCDVVLSTSAFKFNLRRYNWASYEWVRHRQPQVTLQAGDYVVGAHTRSLFSST